MNCPDWTSLAAHRHGGDSEPEGWSEALTHFDGCQLCRKQALKADPTLVFRRLPPVSSAAMTAAQEQAEVESVRQAVAAMRAASRLDPREARRSTSSGWKRWAAAAALALAALTLPSHESRESQDAGETAAIFREGRMTEMAELAEMTELSSVTPELVADAPAGRQVGLSWSVIEGVSSPGARVYEMIGGEMPVVMVVNEDIDL
jgi:hypothetical protein